MPDISKSSGIRDLFVTLVDVRDIPLVLVEMGFTRASLNRRDPELRIRIRRRLMIAPLRPEHRVIVLATILWSWTASAASAQALDQQSATTSSFASVKARVALGDVVYVTDKSGITIKGKLAELTDDAVRVTLKADVRTVAAADVRRIQWQQPDSLFTGVLIGGAVGAIPGIYWLVADPNECSGMCPEEYALIAVGAVVGGIIDHLIRRRVTVYGAGSSGRSDSVTIGPFVMRDRRGLRVAVTF